MYYIINIGSNLGDRRLNLSKAMRRVGLEFGNFEMSHVIETEPWGYDSSNKFLNLCMIFQSDEEPQRVLEKLQTIEKEISPASHRNADGGYKDRIIDIDILAADDMTVSSPTLTLPHPNLAERDFFLVPMAEIAPGWRHPASGLTASDMLARLKARKNDD